MRVDSFAEHQCTFLWVEEETCHALKVTVFHLFASRDNQEGIEKSQEI